jgi:hypothetical protein
MKHLGQVFICGHKGTKIFLLSVTFTIKYGKGGAFSEKIAIFAG